MVKGISRPHRKKKGVSLMVSYVLLVVIAISVSVFVYAYLKLYLPEDRKECEIDAKIIVTSAPCLLTHSHDLAVTLENRGLFNITGAFVKLDEADKRVKRQINKDDEFLSKPLSPGESVTLDFNNLSYMNLNDHTAYEVEIEPAILDQGFLIPCKNSIVTYPVTCKY